jgi:hypothetical protein
MNQRAFISCTTFGMLAGPLDAPAQQTGKVYRVGHLAARITTVVAGRVPDFLGHLAVVQHTVSTSP